MFDDILDIFSTKKTLSHEMKQQEFNDDPEIQFVNVKIEINKIVNNELFLYLNMNTQSKIVTSFTEEPYITPF